MRTIYINSVLLVVFLSFALNLNSQSRVVSRTSGGGGPAVGISLVSANIVQPIGLVKSSDLTFGSIASAQSQESVTISPEGNRIASGGVTLISAGDASYAASFSVVGYPYATFSIGLPSSVIIISGTDQMSVNNFVSSLGLSSSLDPQGEATLNIGATLNVNPNQESGVYIGSFDIVVAYN